MLHKCEASVSLDLPNRHRDITHSSTPVIGRNLHHHEQVGQYLIPTQCSGDPHLPIRQRHEHSHHALPQTIVFLDHGHDVIMCRQMWTMSPVVTLTSDISTEFIHNGFHVLPPFSFRMDRPEELMKLLYRLDISKGKSGVSRCAL